MQCPYRPHVTWSELVFFFHVLYEKTMNYVFSGCRLDLLALNHVHTFFNSELAFVTISFKSFPVTTKLVSSAKSIVFKDVTLGRSLIYIY